MKLNVKLTIALISLVAGTFGLASKSFAQLTTPATSTVTNNKLEVQSGNDSNTTPAAAAAIFSIGPGNNVTGGGVAASVGSTTAGAAVTQSSRSKGGDGSTAETTAAAALGGDGHYELNVNAKAGTINFTSIETAPTITPPPPSPDTPVNQSGV